MRSIQKPIGAIGFANKHVNFKAIRWNLGHKTDYFTNETTRPSNLKKSAKHFKADGKKHQQYSVATKEIMDTYLKYLILCMYTDFVRSFRTGKNVNFVPYCCYCFVWLPFAPSASSSSISPEDKHTEIMNTYSFFMVNEWAVTTLTSCTCGTSSVNILTRFCFLPTADPLLRIVSGVNYLTLQLQ